MERKTILKVAMITAFITTFMGSSLNLSIPNLEADFQVGATLVGWVITAYTLSVAAFSVPLGKLADITGRRRVMLLGIGGFGITSLCCAFATNIWILLGLRVLQGFTASMIFSTNNAILISAYPASQRGRVLGLSTAATYVGLSVGPVVGGFLNHHLDWHAIFIMASMVAFVGLALAVKGVPRQKAQTEQKVTMDVSGNILYIACIVVTLYGLTNLSMMKHAWLILAAGVGLGIAFVVVERRAENPVIKISMFTKDKAFAFSNLAALLNFSATFALSYLMSIYLQVVMGYTSQAAGLILIALPVVQAILSPRTGRLSDRIPPYKLASLGMACCALSLLLFFFISTETKLWYIVMALMVMGLGVALFSSPNTNAIMSSVEKQDYSVANSIVATMRTVGQSSSMAVVTIVVGFTMGRQGLNGANPVDLVNTMHIIFGIFVVLCVTGIGLSVQRGNK